MSRLLVVGASGLLGGHLLGLRPEAVGTYRRSARAGLRPLDLARAEEAAAFADALAPLGTVVVATNPPSLEWCEQHPAAARQELVGDLAVFLRALGRSSPRAVVVYLSTDYVFDGRKGEYREEDATGPLQAYGRCKLDAEKAVEASGLSHWIVRTSVLYGENRWDPESARSFPLAVLAAARSGAPLAATDNLWSKPTEVSSLAAFIWSLAGLGGSGGRVHAVGGPRLTRLDIARATLSAWGLAPWPGLHASSADEEGRIPGQSLRRPRDSSLDTGRLQALWGRALPPLEEGLRQLRARLGG